MRLFFFLMALLAVFPLCLANYCVNCDTFISCLLVCRDGYNKLARVDR